MNSILDRSFRGSGVILPMLVNTHANLDDKPFQGHCL
jgi:hypothetical protein